MRWGMPAAAGSLPSSLDHNHPTAKQMKKRLLITGCTDGLMWYRDKVGQTVPFLYEADGTYWSVEDGGFKNIVLKKDAKIVCASS